MDRYTTLRSFVLVADCVPVLLVDRTDGLAAAQGR